MIAVGLCDPGDGKGGGQVLHEPLWETKQALVLASTAEKNWLCKCFQFDTEWSSSTLLCVCALVCALFVCLTVHVCERLTEVWTCIFGYTCICEPVWNSFFKWRPNYPKMSILPYSVCSDGCYLSADPFCKSPFSSPSRWSSQEQEAMQHCPSHFIIPDLNNY